MIVDSATKTLLANSLFQSPDFETTWMECKNFYEILGFRDKISDSEMISEFKYIAQQLRKYVFTKQSTILDHDTYEEMADAVDNLIGKAAEYGDERKEIVYNFMRDHWLLELRGILARIIEANESDEYYEEENDV